MSSENGTQQTESSSSPQATSSAGGDERWIVVAGNGAEFSHDLIDYAIWFAMRLDYSMAALSFVPAGSSDAPKVLEPFTEQVQKSFEVEAARGVEVLAYRAAAENIPFRHLVKFGSRDHCILETYREIEKIDYVIIEPDKLPLPEDIDHAIPVFAMAR